MSVRLMSLVFELDLEPSLKLVLLALADRANDDGEAYPGVRSMAAKCSMSENTVRRKLHELQDLNLIKINFNEGGKDNWRKDRRPNLYTLTFNGVSTVVARDDERPPKSRGNDLPNIEERPPTIGSLYINNTSINTKLGLNDLVKIYFDNYEGELKPSGAQIAGHLQLAIKRGATIERLAEIIPTIAQEGKPITINVIQFALAKSKDPKLQPTPTPPSFRAEDLPEGVPMPVSVKQMFDSIFKGADAF